MKCSKTEGWLPAGFSAEDFDGTLELIGGPNDGEVVPFPKDSVLNYLFAEGAPQHQYYIDRARRKAYHYYSDGGVCPHCGAKPGTPCDETIPPKVEEF